jgi:Ca2+-binding RTX toxin-like protein
MNFNSYYEFVLAQFAAESYLDGLFDSSFNLNNEFQRAERLENGANRYDVIDQLRQDDKLGPTQMTGQMVADFESTWQIVTHIPNQISGFSATLLQHKTTGEFTLSFRGTEPKNENDGGDRRRDVFGANAEITFDGFSFAQIQDMEEFYKQIKNGYAYNDSTQSFEADAALDVFKGYMADNGKLNLTGYSLGGHLAQIFTLLHYDEVLHTYTFNGAGFGDFPQLQDNAGTAGNYATNLQGALLVLEDIQQNPLDYINQARGNDLLAIVNILDGKGAFEAFYQTIVAAAELIGLVLPKYQGEIVTTAVKLLEYYRDTKVEEGDDKELLVKAFQLYHDEYYQYPNITLSSRYGDPLYLYAEKIVSRDLEGVAVATLQEKILNDRIEYGREQVTPDEKITNLYGLSYVKSLFAGELVAGSGQLFGDFSGIFIEDQPNLDNHSITLLADSLALMSLIDTIDPNINLGGNNRSEINQILASASSASSNNLPLFQRAEGDALEKTLDMLGKLFLPDPWTTTGISYEPGSFADVDLRNSYYDHLQLLRTELIESQGNLKPKYQGLKITGLYNANATELKLKAEGDTNVLSNQDDAVAWRYALVNLNPFVITGNPALYEPHNLESELDLFNPDTKEGVLTEDYLKDRAAFLVATIEANLRNDTGINKNLGDEYGNTKFIDANDGDTDPNTAITVTNTSPLGSVDRLVIFGLQGDDVNTPQTGATILHGSDGNDAIYGQGGNDKLSGGEGRDLLVGGAGADTLYGGGLSAPALEHEDDGIKDTLKGGAGNDTYYVGHLDVIEDADASEQTELIDFYDIDVRGTYEHLAGEVYKHENNGLLLILSGRDANIKQVTDDGTKFFTIKNFLDENGQRNDGEYGISLDIPTPPEPTQVYTNPAGTTEFTIRESNLTDSSTVISGPYEKAVGNDDAVFLGATGSLGNLIYHEIIDVERSPGFVVEGGAGYDWIRIDYNVSPFVSGQTYEPTAGGPGGFSTGVEVHGQGGDDIIYGGLDNDRLFGGEGDDLIATWDGNDVHHGGAGNDTLGSNDFFFGKNQTEGANFDVTADDFYFGGAGKDFITDDWGNDTAFGDEGSDFIATGSGADTVFGGDGDDVIYSDRRFSGFHGERSWTLFYDGKGRPVNVNLFSMTFQGEALQAGGDYIDGGAGSDLILSGKGDDTVLGGSGNDAINAQSGDDYVDGGDDDDLIFGEDGFDVLAGGKGEDSIHGGADDDFIEGGADDDYLKGDAGNDDISGDAGEDRIYGGTGDDSLYGGSENDELYGEAGQDTLFGGSGEDILDGGADFDFLDGGLGADTLYGRDGEDTLIIGEGDTVDGGQDDDHYYLLADVTDANIIDSQGNDTLEFTENITASDLIINRVNGNVTITTPESQVTINDWANNTFERLLFSDASELTNTDIEAAINDKPVLDGTLADQVINEDAFFEYVIPETTFSDPDGDSLTYSATLTNDDPLPGWLNFDPLTLSFSGIPKNADVGNIDVKFIATDAGGLSESTIFNLQINNVNDTPSAAPDAASLTLLGASSSPEITPDPEFLVSDSGTSGYGITSNVANLSDGGYVIAWEESGGGIYSQAYYANGTKNGDIVAVASVSSYITYSTGPAVVGLTDGSYFVSWIEDSFDSSNSFDTEVVGQRFSADGTPINSKVSINTDTSNSEYNVNLAPLLNGQFVAAWDSGLTSGINTTREVIGQKFDSDGNKSGAEFIIASAYQQKPMDPAVSPTADGGFLVTWRSEDEAAPYDNERGIFVKHFDSDINDLSGDIHVLTSLVSLEETTPDVVALDNGNFLVTWMAAEGISDFYILGQLFDSSYQAISGYISITDLPDSEAYKSDPSIVALNDGGFLVAWVNTDPRPEYNTNVIFGQRYDANGSTFGNRFLVNEFAVDSNPNPDSIRLSDGSILVTWTSDDANWGISSDSIAARRFDPSGGAVDNTVIIDVLANDMDVDAADDASNFTLVSATLQGGRGQVSIDNNQLVFDPGTDFDTLADEELAVVEIDYVMQDAQGSQSSSMVTLTIGKEGATGQGTNGNDFINVPSDQLVVLAGNGDDIINIFDYFTVPDKNLLVYSGNGNDTVNITGSIPTSGAQGRINTGAGNDTINIDLRNNSGATIPGFIFNLSGGAGDDTYIYAGTTAGAIRINDITPPTQQQLMKFQFPIEAGVPRLGFGSLKMTFNGNPVEVHFENFDPNDVFGGPRDINVFEFDDVTLTYEQLLARGFDIDGTAGDDTLSGTNTTDRINGLAGNDAITSGDGDDVITGGAGNDDLRGGRGNDTYIFNRVDGRDVITDNQGIDQITFGPGVDLSDLRVTQQGDDLIIGLLDNGQPTDDQITLSNWFVDGNRQVEMVQLSSGETVSAAELEAMIPTENAYRYYRFTPTKLRNDARANSVQVSELQLFYQGQAVTGATVSNPGGINPVNEEPFRAVDGDTASKWLDFNKGSLVFDYGDAIVIDGFSWSTANDHPERDPVRWRLEGSTNNQDWTVLDDQTGADFAVPTARFTAIPEQAFVNIAPVAEDDTGTVMTGSSVNINVINNDTDPDDGLDPAGIRIETTPVNGTVTVNEDGTVTYDHDGSSTGADSFTYTIADVSGDASNPATVDLTVLEQDGTAYRYYRLTPTKLRNDATANSVQVSELQLFYQGQALTGATVSNPGGSNPQNEEPFRAVDGDLTSKWLDFNKGPLVLDFGTELVADSYRFATANDHAERDPVRWRLEASQDQLEWNVLDDQSGADFPTPLSRFTFLEEKTFTNEAPAAADDTATVMTGSSVNIHVINNDTDPDDGLDPASINIQSGPEHGSLFSNDDGTVIYTHDGSETFHDSFTYTIADQSGAESEPATVDLGILDQTGSGYRYYRLTPTKLRNDATANSVQVSELQLFYQGQVLTGATVSNPGGSNPLNEEPFRVADGDLTSKWLDFNKGSLVLDFGTELVADSYRFATANDHAERDPVRWRLEASNNNTDWVMLDDQTLFSADVPTDRFSFIPEQMTADVQTGVDPQGGPFMADAGSNTLLGLTGDDHYVLQAGSGVDHIHDTGGDDTLEFTGLQHNDLWFWQYDQDLRVGAVGSQDYVSIQDWYADETNHIETMTAADGSATLINTQVQQLVEAMAVFDVQAAGNLNVPQQHQDDVQSVIAAAWTTT